MILRCVRSLQSKLLTRSLEYDPSIAVHAEDTSYPFSRRRKHWTYARRLLLLGVGLIICWPLISASLHARQQREEWSRLVREQARIGFEQNLREEGSLHRRLLVRGAGLPLTVSHKPRDSPASTNLEQPEETNGLLSQGSGTSSTINREGTRRPPSFLESEFPPYEEYASLVKKSSLLPDVVHVPFSDAVADFHLPGWAEEWISRGEYDANVWGNLTEPKIDFIYTWVNGSDPEFRETRRWYEENSTLNDLQGEWLARHGQNRYRDWDELRFSIRSVEKFALFRNNIFLLSNAVRNGTNGQLMRQTPSWLNKSPTSLEKFHVLVQDDYFDEEKKGCIPAFNSLTVENQMFNIKSDVDPIFALSDDMILGKPHAASDIWSPFFGPMMGFKSNSYSTTSRPTEEDAKRFGEKPWLIYTSWLLNRRFGNRKRKGQAHFGHPITRSVSREAMSSFPGPELRSACSRFRGDFQFQLYLWYGTFHYTIERHREALLWSYITIRADENSDGILSWDERRKVIAEISEGMENTDPGGGFRTRNYYHVPDILESAGLQAPIVNTEILWTSLDGPVMIRDLECLEFDLDECLAPGFSVEDKGSSSVVFSASVIFDRVSRQNVKCGDCLIKLLLHRVEKGLEPMLPLPDIQAKQRETVIKALLKYQYTIINPDALFIMVTDAEQVETAVLNRLVKKSRMVGQLCLNDDVQIEDDGQLRDLQSVMTEMYSLLFPEPSLFEI